MNGWLLEGARVVAPIAALTLGIVGYRYVGTPPEAKSREQVTEEVRAVETVRVEPAEQGLELEFDGLVVPYREVVLGADVGGRVTRKFGAWKAGSFVDSNTPLLEIDESVHRIARNAARALWKQAELDWEEARDTEVENLEKLEADARERRDLAQADFERTRRLYLDGIATKAALDGARQTLLQAQTQLTEIENKRKLNENKIERLRFAADIALAQYSDAYKDWQRSVVRAPCCGVIIEDNVEQDGFVQRGEKLVTIEDTRRVEVQCNLTLDEMAWLWRDARAQRDGEKYEPQGDLSVTDEPAAPPTPEEEFAKLPEDIRERLLAYEREHAENNPFGNYFENEPFVDTDPSDNAAYRLPPVPVTISFDVAGRSYEWDGVFERYDGLGVDQRSRTVPCRLTVPDPRKYRVDGEPSDGTGPRALIRGMYVTVRAKVQPRVDLLVIPEKAVRPGNEAWLVKSNGNDDETAELEIVPVDVAWREPGRVYVVADKSKLREGSRLIVSPLPEARPGLAIAPRAAPQKSSRSETGESRS